MESKQKESSVGKKEKASAGEWMQSQEALKSLDLTVGLANLKRWLEDERPAHKMTG